jgi:hypothetical protein
MKVRLTAILALALALMAHACMLNPQRIERLLIKENGRGLFFLTEPPSFSKIEKVVATGPKRSILAKTNLSVHFATPAGDVMMTGPIGLVEAAKRKLDKT